MEVEVTVLSSPSLMIVLMVSVDVEATLNEGSPELRSSVKVEVAVLGSPSLIVRTVCVDV